MTVSLLEQTIAVIVIEDPSRSKTFEKFHIDFCCGGQRTLEEACRLSGVEPSDVLMALKASEEPVASNDNPDWADFSLRQLIDHIVEVHHGFLREELPRLGNLLQRVVLAHGEKHLELRKLQRVFALLKSELVPHMMKEEQVLFPIIRELEVARETDSPSPRFHCGSVENPILAMEDEHQHAGKALRQMRELTSDFKAPTDACATYHALLSGLVNLESDLHLHIHKENNILFPKAAKLEAELLVCSEENRQ